MKNIVHTNRTVQLGWLVIAVVNIYVVTVCVRVCVCVCVQGAEGEADLNTIKELVEDALYSTQPSLVLSLRSCESSATVRPAPIPWRPALGGSKAVLAMFSPR